MSGLRSSQRRHSVDQCCGLHIERVNFRMRFASAKSLRCIASMNRATHSRTLGVRVMDVSLCFFWLAKTPRILFVAASAEIEKSEK